MSREPHSSDSDDLELKEVLNQFYKEIAVPPSNTMMRLHSVAEEILRRVAERDSRFSGDSVDVGSNASGLSAITSSEFDILLILNIEGTFEEYNSSPGLARYRLTTSSSALWGDANESGYLQPRKLADIFQKHVREVVSSMTADLELTVGGEDSAAITVSSRMKSFMKYKADLVVALKCRGWPSSANASWLQPGYSREWPKRGTINIIKQNGFELIAKFVHESTPGVKVQDKDFLWTISMSRAESLLLEDIDDGRLCHKKCLKIMKALRLTFLHKPGQPVFQEQTPIVSSYQLKTMLFWESQSFPEAMQWTEEKLLERFTSFAANFHHRLMEKNLPNFFFSGINLYRGEGGMGALLSSLCTNPIAYIRSVESTVAYGKAGHIYQ